MSSAANRVYRYKCVTEDALVWETKSADAAAPTTCVNEGGALATGSLVIVEEPIDVSDLTVNRSAVFTGATIVDLSHTALTDIGTHTHTQLDAHLVDVSLHRTINDGNTGSNDLWSASKITTQLATKAATTHTHMASEVTDWDTAVDTRISAQKGAADGLATLDSNQKIPTGQLPALAITNVSVVADIAARDALSPQEGDVAKVLDDGSGNAQTYIYDGSAWQDIQETANVVSVNGQIGTVSLTTTHIAEGDNLYYTDVRVSSNSAVAANTGHRGDTSSNPHSVTLDQVTSATAKGDLLGHTGTVHAVVNVGADGTVLAADSTQSAGVKWATNKKFHGSCQLPAVSTISAQWTRADHFIWPGSTIDAANLSRVLVNASADTGVTYKVRLYDATHGTEIALSTGLTNTTPAIIALGSLGNVPSSDSIFEVHIARTEGSLLNAAVYHSVTVEYQ